MALVLTCHQALAEESKKPPVKINETFEILGCSDGCTYHSFITALDAAVPEIKLSHKKSGGSKENVETLNDGKAEFAIVQADALYNGYRGQEGVRKAIGYSALLPLFPNYVQLLARRDSGIEEFDDLKGKRVGIGKEGSGSQTNAMKILNLANLDVEQDIVKVEKSSKEALDLFKRDKVPAEAKLDALFVTGKLRVPEESGDYYHVAIPEKYIVQLIKTPYYTSVNSPDLLNMEDSEDPMLHFSAKMPSLTAYLVASDKAAKSHGDKIETLIRAVAKSWQDIKWEGLSTARDPRTDFKRTDNPVIPYHPATRKVLAELGYDAGIETINIYGGSLGGTYNKFIDVVNVEDRKRDVLHIKTGGSKANLAELAKRGKSENPCLRESAQEQVCFAIVQDDAAYKEYYGKSNVFTRLLWRVDYLRKQFGPGFRAVLPLFPNYVQVLVAQDSGIGTLDDLVGKSVGIGAAGSATFSNAKDVLEESKIPWESFEHVASGEGIKRLKMKVSENGVQPLDALFVTGMLRIPPEDGAYRHLAIPEDTLNKLTNLEEKPYYEKITSPDELTNFKAPMLSLTAYLVASDHASPDEIKTIIKSLTRSWKTLETDYKWRLKNLEDVGTRKPIPFHPVTNKVLAESNYVTPEKIFLPVLLRLGAVILILLLVLRWMHKDSYNRLGQEAHIKAILLDRFSPWIAAICIAAAFVTFLVVVIVIVTWAEGALSSRSNVHNNFVKLDIKDSILWIFTFMATGYENDVYPVSIFSKIVVAIAAMVGLVAPFALAYSGVSKLLEQRFSRLSGDSAFSHLTDHVLICGWNAKVKYLIWTLTGEDAPSKKQVVVVADIEGQKPLTHFNFDKDLVSYCRGDSADSAVLDRANAKDASLAIVVADDGKLATNNLGSALTVLALRRKNPDIFIASELDSEKNRLFFDASGSDATVDSQFLSDRLLTLSCLFPYLSDFVLDAITHDEYSEFYSQSVDELCKKFGIDEVIPTLAELQDIAHFRGLNIMGAERADDKHDIPAVRSGNAKEQSFNLLLSNKEMCETLSREDTVVIAADDLLAIEAEGYNSDMAQLSPDPSCLRLLGEATPQKILIVGEQTRAEGIRENLGLSSAKHDVVILSPGKESEAIEEHLLELLVSTRFDCVLVLNEALGIDALSDQKAFIGDAKVILRVQLIDKLSRENSKSEESVYLPKIVAEINQQKNRRLLVEAGATTIVPSLLTTARFLTKLVYGRGYVYRLIVTLLTMRKGTYLRSLVLEEGHPLLGKTYLESLRTIFEDARVIGCLPNDGKVMSELRNDEEDFDTHFVMSPAKESRPESKKRGQLRRNDADRPLCVGDTLIVIGLD
ncbi:MAG: TAXI family TRAP transporter solute-binding subunit [Halieaceae bacterium]